MKKIDFYTTALLMSLWIATAAGAQGLSIGSGTTFSLGSSTLRLSGNQNHAGTFTAGTGTVVFNDAGGIQTIAGPSGEIFFNLLVSKAAGDVHLLNNMAVTGTLTITSGDVDLNGNILTLGSTGTLSESPGATVKGTSGYITATRDINAPASNAGLNAILGFNYDDSELNGLTENNFLLFKSMDNRTSWTNQGGTAASVINTVTKPAIASFSRWTVGDSSQPLSAPEMDIRGNGISIADGDTTPDTADNTDFGSTGLVSGGITHTFALLNTGTDPLILTDPSPYVSIGGDPCVRQ